MFEVYLHIEQGATCLWRVGIALPAVQVFAANYWTARTEKPRNRLKSYAGLTPPELKSKL